MKIRAKLIKIISFNHEEITFKYLYQDKIYQTSAKFDSVVMKDDELEILYDDYETRIKNISTSFDYLRNLLIDIKLINQDQSYDFNQLITVLNKYKNTVDKLTFLSIFFPNNYFLHRLINKNPLIDLEEYILSHGIELFFLFPKIKLENLYRYLLIHSAIIDNHKLKLAMKYQLVIDHLNSNNDLFIYYAVEDEDIEQLIDLKYLYLDYNRLYLRENYFDEKFLANYLVDSFDYEMINFTQQIKEIELEQGFSFDESQKDAIEFALGNKISVINGLAGTGKTTITKAIIDIYLKLYPQASYKLMALSAKAAKRLSQVTGLESSTIHSFLKYDFHSDNFNFNFSKPIEVNFLVIDEVSMIDQEIMVKIFKACKEIDKILLIGDAFQLPSIKEGRILYDIINSDLNINISLNQVHRQENANQISQLAYDLRYNLYNENQQYLGVEFFGLNDFEQFLNQRIENHLLENLIFLSPKYLDSFGINYINQKIVGELNPKKSKYFKGQRLLQLKNRPDLNIYNGDILSLVDFDEHSLQLLKFDETINLNLIDAKDLTDGYCLSVHKMQGSEYAEVALIIPSYQPFIDLHLLYTAITRAKQKLYIFSDSKVFNQVIKTKNNFKRKSYLKERINYRLKKDTA